MANRRRKSPTFFLIPFKGVTEVIDHDKGLLQGTEFRNDFSKISFLNSYLLQAVSCLQVPAIECTELLGGESESLMSLQYKAPRQHFQQETGNLDSTVASEIEVQPGPRMQMQEVSSCNCAIPPPSRFARGSPRVSA